MPDSGVRRTALGALLGLLLAEPALAAPDLRLVAMTGGPAPGGGVFAEFYRFGSLQIDDSGDVAFTGELQGSVLQGGSHGIWSERNGVLGQRAREGLDMPDLAGAEVYGATFSSLRMAGDGTLSFQTRIGTEDSFPIYEIGETAQLRQMVPDDAPELPDDIDLVDAAVISYAGGFAAYHSHLEGPGVTAADNEAIYVTTDTGTSLVVRDGLPAPGSVRNFHDLFNPMVNASGDVAFGGVLDDLDQTSGFWAQDATGDVQAVALPGDAAPGLPGLTFGEVGGISWNGDHEVLFYATLLGSGINGSNYVVLYQGPIHAPAKLARYGDTAPGTGAAFSFFDDYAMTGDGRTTWIAELVTGNPNNDTGIWTGTPGDVQLVARENAVAPGTGGALFAEFSQLAVNRDGACAFHATLRGGGVTEDDDGGVWRLVDGELELVLRDGAEIEVAPGDVRVVGGVGLGSSRSPDGGGDVTMNASGALVFSLFFVDHDQAVFVAPEPGGSVLAFAAVACVLALRTVRSAHPARDRREGRRRRAGRACRVPR